MLRGLASGGISVMHIFLLSRQIFSRSEESRENRVRKYNVGRTAGCDEHSSSRSMQ